MLKLQVLWRDLRDSLWFIPGLIVLGAIALAIGLIEADVLVSPQVQAEWPRVFGAGADGSRGMLAAIAGSMITIAGVTFSIIIVALALASSQYTPRILRNFMADRANQAVLGAFVGIFTYCLFVLRTIRGGDGGSFVPSLAVLFGFVLALLGVGMLIFFIHHIAVVIQASTIIANITEETQGAIDHLFPERLGKPGEEDELDESKPPLIEGPWRAIPALRTGYIQNLDGEALLRFAAERNTVLRMECGIGEFAIENAPLLSMADNEAPDEETIKALNQIYGIARHRTVDQDAAFGMQQVVDIALKALSPGINDTTTAVTCVNHLNALLLRLARHRIPSPYRFSEGKLRVIAKGPSFESLLAVAFDQIRRNAEGKVSVIERMLHGLDLLAAQTNHAGRRRALQAQFETIMEMAERSIVSPYDRAALAAKSFPEKRTAQTEIETQRRYDHAYHS